MLTDKRKAVLGTLLFVAKIAAIVALVTGVFGKSAIILAAGMVVFSSIVEIIILRLTAYTPATRWLYTVGVLSLAFTLFALYPLGLILFGAVTDPKNVLFWTVIVAIGVDAVTDSFRLWKM